MYVEEPQQKVWRDVWVPYEAKMHHLGIEPRTSAWKADILPLN